MKRLKKKERKNSEKAGLINEEEEGKKIEIEDKDEDILDLKEVVRRVQDFVRNLLPNSIEISEFNGNFVYQVTIS